MKLAIYAGSFDPITFGHLDVIQRARNDGTAVILAGVHMQPLVALTDSDAVSEIGSENLVDNIDLALARAREILGGLSAEVQHGADKP